MKLALLSCVAVLSLSAQEWSAPVHVLHELKPCVTYRARVDGPMLVIAAEIQPGWHTFTMDNDKRATAKLAGKPSLGVDQPTRFEVAHGLQVDGGWLQAEPRDFSKPQLRWYSWGYEEKALFAAKVKRAGNTSGSAQIGIRGQACTDKTCKNIDLTLDVPLSGAPESATSAATAADVKALIPVRE